MMTHKSIIKTTLMALLAMATLSAHTPLWAQLPRPPIEANIEVNDPTPRLHETFALTLKVITRNLDIHQQLDLDQLPDPDALTFLTPFEALPQQRNTDGRETVIVRTYRAKVRPMVTGSITINPRLRFTARRRVSSLFGSVFHDQPVQMDVSPLTLNILPLPDPPANFSGAVGDFNITVTATPTNIVEGGLVTLITRIEGPGWLAECNIPEIIDQSGINAYPVNQTTQQPELNIYEQTLVIESDAVSAIPAIAFWYFDTQEDGYRELNFGPFPLNFIPEQRRIVQRFQPSQTTLSAPTSRPSEVPDVTRQIKQKLADGDRVRISLQESTQARFAPASSSLVMFTIQAGSEIELITEYREWGLIQFGRNQGWVPLIMLQSP